MLGTAEYFAHPRQKVQPCIGCLSNGSTRFQCHFTFDGSINLKTYVLTPGQSDVLRGSYTLEFINTNVIAVSMEAPTALSQKRIQKAMLEMAKIHPGLRSVLTAVDPGLDGRQWIRSEGDALACALFTQREISPERSVDELSLLVAQMANRLDLAAGITWGVIQLRVGTSYHVVFVFNHILCDFLAASQFIEAPASAGWILVDTVGGERDRLILSPVTRDTLDLFHRSTTPPCNRP